MTDLGLGLQGAASQIGDIDRRRIAKRGLDLEERRLGIEEKADESARFGQFRTQAIKNGSDFTDQWREAKSKFPGTEKEWQTKFGPIISESAAQFTKTAEMARSLGIEIPDIGQQVLAQIQAQPTAQQAQVGEARGEAVAMRATADELISQGIPEAQALAAAGIPEAEIPKFQSDVGKAISDLEIARDRFGEGSPQVTALTEALQSKQSGQATPDFGDVRGLRQEFTKASQEFVGVLDAFDRLKFAAASETPAGDVALIFSFMKMLDPESTVREGEFATAEQAGSVPQRITSLYNRALEGTRLANDIRQDFLNQGKGIFVRQLQKQISREQEFSRLASEFRFPPEQVIIDFKQGMTPEDIKFATTPTEVENLAGQRLQIDTDENILSKPISEITTDEVRKLTPEGRQRLKEMLQNE